MKIRTKYLTAINSSIITVTIDTTTVNASRVRTLKDRKIVTVTAVDIIPFHSKIICAITTINRTISIKHV